MKKLITRLFNFRKQRKYQSLLQQRLSQQQQSHYNQPPPPRYGIFKNLLIFSVVSIAGFVILLQQLEIQFYRSDDYIISIINAIPTQTPLPSQTPLPTYTPQPIAIIIATPIVAITDTNTINVVDTPIAILEPTPTLAISDEIVQTENKIVQPEYNFNQGASTGNIVTDNDVFLPPDNNQQIGSSDISAQAEFDLAGIYQFVIALLAQFGILSLLSANIQLIVIVGIAFLVLALFLR